MIPTLMRRDSALRYMGRWMFVGPLLTLTMMGVVAASRLLGSAEEPTIADIIVTLVTLWIPSAVYVGVNVAERRCSRFDMELPIASRELWTSRLIAVSIAGLAILGVTAGLMWFIGWAVHNWLGAFPAEFGGDVILLALRVATVVLLGTAVAQSVFPSLERLPSGRRLTWSIIGGVFGLFPLVLALGLLPPAVSLVPLVVAVFLVGRTYATLPSTVVVAPREPVWLSGGSSAGRPAEGGSAGRGGSWEDAPPRGAFRRFCILLTTIARGTTKMPLAPIVGVPILLAAGFAMAGTFGEGLRGDDSIRFSLLFIISYTLLSFSGLPPRKLFLFDAMPVSRRAIFAAIYLPLMLTLALGYAGGRIVADRLESSEELIRYVEIEGHYYVSAPLREGEIALDGAPPAATSPWGESHEVWSLPIVGGGTPVVHSRFSTPPGSSREFVALQISRAVASIYGQDISPEEISARYLDADASGRIVPRGGALTLAADHPDWRVSPYGPVFPVMLLIVCVPWMIALTLYLRTLRAGYTERRRKGTFWWGMVILMGLHLTQFAAIFTDLLDHWTLSGTLMIVIRELAERLPGGSFTVWVLCGLIIYVFYRLAENRFLKVESSPGDDMRIALIERPLGAAGQEGAYAR